MDAGSSRAATEHWRRGDTEANVRAHRSRRAARARGRAAPRSLECAEELDSQRRTPGCRRRGRAAASPRTTPFERAPQPPRLARAPGHRPRPPTRHRAAARRAGPGARSPRGALALYRRRHQPRLRGPERSLPFHQRRRHAAKTGIAAPGRGGSPRPLPCHLPSRRRAEVVSRRPHSAGRERRRRGIPPTPRRRPRRRRALQRERLSQRRRAHPCCVSRA